MKLKLLIEHQVNENNPNRKSLPELANAIDVPQKTLKDILDGAIPSDNKTLEKIIDYFIKDFSHHISNNNPSDDKNTGEVQTNHARYTRLLEYCIYIYEEEKDRRNILNNTSKIYMAAQLFILTVLGSKIIGADKFFDSMHNIYKSTNNLSFNGTIIIMIFVVAIITFFFSFVLAVLVNKMWDRQRLNNPEELVSSIGQFPSENMLIAKMAADYAVASNTNHYVNDKKALLLKYSLFSFLASIFFIVFGFAGAIILTN